MGEIRTCSYTDENDLVETWRNIVIAKRLEEEIAEEIVLIM